MLSLALCLVALPATAQTEGTSETDQTVGAADPTASAPAAKSPWIYLGAAFGCAGIIIGASYGISKIGSSAVESMARQPEVAGNINTAMIISAALIEGATFFALIVCLLSFIM
ncbi:MAG: ATP synthase F0 subunit C [Pirellulaceae bacterium]|nr:ATP synthase F0 subunit C [Pirellulaceae bacterium]